jgi:repressor LexA
VALTERQQKMLDFIGDFIDENGYPPTIREIGRKLGISSTSVVNYNLNKLKQAGYLERDGQVSRGLKVVGRPNSPSAIPIWGTIAAGAPIPVMEGQPDQDLDYLELTRDVVSSRGEVFALHVKGDSMIDALIHDGDIVVMEQSQTAQNGDMVAAWIRDREETTLKRFYQENGRVRLQPANPTMAPIFVSPDNVEIQGKVIAVIRNLA